MPYGNRYAEEPILIGAPITLTPAPTCDGVAKTAVAAAPTCFGVEIPTIGAVTYPPPLFPMDTDWIEKLVNPSFGEVVIPTVAFAPDPPPPLIEMIGATV